MNSDEINNQEKPQIENENKQQNETVNKPKKRGRKKKIPEPFKDDEDYVQPNNNNNTTNNNNNPIQNENDHKNEKIQSDDDDDVVIIKKKEASNTTPKKRGRKKKNKDDLDYVPSNFESSTEKKSENQENSSTCNANQDLEIEIKNGINDLTNLPIELLRMELVQRGYEEGVINRLDKWYLVSMLRETAFNHFNYFSFYSSRFGMNSWERNDGPMEKIFENDPETERKRLEEQRLKKEKEIEDEENDFDDESINPDEFSKGKSRKFPGKHKRIFDFL